LRNYIHRTTLGQLVRYESSEITPSEVLEIIDLTMDDNDELIPNILYHKDEAPVGWTPNNAPPFNAGRDTTM
jgi:hypothetical protein